MLKLKSLSTYDLHLVAQGLIHHSLTCTWMTPEENGGLWNSYEGTNLFPESDAVDQYLKSQNQDMKALEAIALLREVLNEIESQILQTN